MSNETKQTAVEWLVKEYHLPTDSPLVQQAKEMEKEQMIKTTLFWSHSQLKREQVVEYINETYGGNK